MGIGHKNDRFGELLADYAWVFVEVKKRFQSCDLNRQKNDKNIELELFMLKHVKRKHLFSGGSRGGSGGSLEEIR